MPRDLIIFMIYWIVYSTLFWTLGCVKLSLWQNIKYKCVSGFHPKWTSNSISLCVCVCLGVRCVFAKGQWYFYHFYLSWYEKIDVVVLLCTASCCAVVWPSPKPKCECQPMREQEETLINNKCVTSFGRLAALNYTCSFRAHTWIKARPHFY